MSWLMIVGVILQALMPILKEWIESLLKDTAYQMDMQGKPGPMTYGDAPTAGVQALIAEAKRKLTFWQRLWGCGRALDRVERALKLRAPALWAVAKDGGEPPVLTKWEIEDIKKVV